MNGRIGCWRRGRQSPRFFHAAIGRAGAGAHIRRITHKSELPMDKRKIGQDGPVINPIGLGCMGLAAFYGPPKAQSEVNALIAEAIDRGVEHFDTAELYLTNEEQLG